MPEVQKTTGFLQVSGWSWPLTLLRPACRGDREELTGCGVRWVVIFLRVEWGRGGGLALWKNPPVHLQTPSEHRQLSSPRAGPRMRPLKDPLSACSPTWSSPLPLPPLAQCSAATALTCQCGFFRVWSLQPLGRGGIWASWTRKVSREPSLCGPDCFCTFRYPVLCKLTELRISNDTMQF